MGGVLNLNQSLHCLGHQVSLADHCVTRTVASVSPLAPAHKPCADEKLHVTTTHVLL
jgi:hypothetical protein